MLRGVSFQVNPQEKIGLVGRNGAGKTTVFRIVTGEESQDSGDIARASSLRIGLLEQHVDVGTAETVHTAALSAFQEIHDIEAEMRRLEKQMETEHSQETLGKYADLQTAFEHADGFSYAARAETILLGLGFPREMWTHDIRFLSGGQKNRLGMVRLLLSNADVLLLDEPTNHLDVNAVEWLEDFLRIYDKTFVIISHDRYFLDRTTTRIIEIDNGKAVNYRGNYSEFLIERELRREQQQREYENQQALIAKTQEFIRRNLEGQKTRQAKSRRNMLERMERVEAVSSEKSGGNFGLKRVERAGNNVLTVDDLAIGYGDKVLADKIGFSLHRGEALGIIGANGTGKTTLLKTLTGALRELSGEINWGTKTNIGYYSQNLGDLEPRNEVIQELRRIAPLAENGELRGFLARFLFFGEDVFKRVVDLSGGEKGRLALARLIYSQKNVLILDEPTNHLDIPSREALESALDEYSGTIITVSHDRFFLDKIATQILSFEENGRVEVYNGNYSEYHDWRERPNAETQSRGERANAGSSATITSAYQEADTSRSEPPPSTGGRAPSKDASEPKSQPAQKGNLSKNQRERIEKRIAEIEREIPLLEEAAEQLSLEMSLPAVAADYARLQEVTRKVQSSESRVRDLYAEWERLSEELI